MSVCNCVCVCVWVHAGVPMCCVWLCVCVSVCYVCMSACVWSCLCVMYVYVIVCVCDCVSVCLYECMLMYLCAMCVIVSVCVYVCVVCVHMSVCVWGCICKCVLCVYVYDCVSVCECGTEHVIVGVWMCVIFVLVSVYGDGLGHLPLSFFWEILWRSGDNESLKPDIVSGTPGVQESGTPWLRVLKRMGNCQESHVSLCTCLVPGGATPACLHSSPATVWSSPHFIDRVAVGTCQAKLCAKVDCCQDSNTGLSFHCPCFETHTIDSGWL